MSNKLNEEREHEFVRTTPFTGELPCKLARENLDVLRRFHRNRWLTEEKTAIKYAIKGINSHSQLALTARPESDRPYHAGRAQELTAAYGREIAVHLAAIDAGVS